MVITKMRSYIFALIRFPKCYKLFNPCKQCIVKACCTRSCIHKKKYQALRYDTRYELGRIVHAIKCRYYWPPYRYSNPAKIKKIITILYQVLFDVYVVVLLIILFKLVLSTMIDT
jgi:hypothetical protein